MTQVVKFKNPPPLVIRRARPMRWFWRALLLLLLGLLGGWMSYQYGRDVADTGPVGEQRSRKAEENRQELADLRRRLADSELSDDADEIARMRRRIQQLEVGGEIEYQASAQLKDIIGELQGEIAALKEEISFYRNIMSPGAEASGLRIEELSLRPGRDARHVKYSLVLIQSVEKHGEIRGEVSLVLRGVRAAQELEESLDFISLSPGAVPTDFRFRYFQELKGEIRLPDDFTPKSVQVSTSLAGGELPLEREFAWEVQSG